MREQIRCVVQGAFHVGAARVVILRHTQAQAWPQWKTERDITERMLKWNWSTNVTTMVSGSWNASPSFTVFSLCHPLSYTSAALSHYTIRKKRIRAWQEWHRQKNKEKQILYNTARNTGFSVRLRTGSKVTVMLISISISEHKEHNLSVHSTHYMVLRTFNLMLHDM